MSMQNETDFKRIRRDDQEGVVFQKHLYVTYGAECPCNCEGCRNRCMDQALMHTNPRALRKRIFSEAENFRYIVFGGGEPLMHIEEIAKLIHRIDDKNNQEHCSDDERIHSVLVTNGERASFVRKIDTFCKICGEFDQVILSRYHYNDSVNERIFRASKQLVDTEDLEDLCYMLKNKMQLSCLCQKGGVETIEDVKEYLKWAANIEILDIMFSGFQDEVTTAEARKLECDPRFLQDAQEMLVKELGFKKEKEIVFSAGFKLTKYKGIFEVKNQIEPELLAFQREIGTIFSMLIGENVGVPVMIEHTKGMEMTVSFREFISDQKVLQAEWEKADYKTFNYSIMPNGEMFGDWTCKHPEKR